VSLKGVWASGPGDVWTVGSDTNRGYIFHLSGDTWQETNTQQSKAFFSGIHGTAPNDVWAVSNQNTVTGNSEFRHWNPGLAQWDSITLPSGTPNLYSVWAASASQVYMVGASGTFLSYDGSKVTSISLSQVMGTSLQHVSGYVDGGRPVVYAVGDAGTIVKIGRLGDTTVLQDKNSMPPPGLLSVGVFPDSAYATADNGSIYTVDSTLTALKLFASSGTTSSPLRGLSAATNGIVWVVGDKDTKRYFDLRP